MTEKFMGTAGRLGNYTGICRKEFKQLVQRGRQLHRIRPISRKHDSVYARSVRHDFKHG
jgi:hypothetical protein